MRVSEEWPAAEAECTELSTAAEPFPRFPRSVRLPLGAWTANKMGVVSGDNTRGEGDPAQIITKMVAASSEQGREGEAARAGEEESGTGR